MKEEDMKDLVVKHDFSIDALAHAVEDLTTTARVTNVKIDKMVDVMSQQNVMFEKINNIDSNAKEAFDKVHEKLRIIERRQTEDGCPTLNSAKDTIKDELRLEFSKDGTSRLYMGLAISFTVMTFVFGYLYIDIKANTETMASVLNKDSYIDKKLSIIEYRISK